MFLCEYFQKKTRRCRDEPLFIFGMITGMAYCLATISISSCATTNCYTYYSYHPFLFDFGCKSTHNILF
jgi:hypothetical protein